MKKFLFSAVALIGFTVASYGANTVEVEETGSTTNCNTYALASTIEESGALGRPMTQSEFAQSYSFWYNFCVSYGKNSNLIVPVFIGN